MDKKIPASAIQLLTTDISWQYRVVPLYQDEREVKLLTDNSVDSAELEILIGKRIEFKEISAEELSKLLSTYYPRKHDYTVTEKHYSDDFLDTLITEAISLGSSDIHIERYEEDCRIRLRVDGKLIEKYTLKSTEYPQLTNKIKIKANLDIAEKRLPQDGRILFKHRNKNIDIRVSSMPSMFGEKIVMRLLSKDETDVDINNLGFNEEQLEAYLEGIKKSHGIILVSGPTGSGKTTTLYATLKVLNNPDINILTIEDPIEYTLRGVNQVQLKESIGLTFASALRTFLRQDPDIIMLGEIRDKETAQMAIRAALTGHLVLSTIHTNSALGTITRLFDLDIPGYLIAGTLNTSLAQRLVRVLCPHCKKEQEFNKKILPKHFKPETFPEKYYLAQGCDHCYYTGFKGRKAIYELVTINEELSENIRKGTIDIKNIKKNHDIRFLSDVAFDLFCKGETTIEEIYPILLT